MKKILSPFLIILFLVSCSSEKLDKDKALKLLKEKEQYPKVATYNVFISDALYAKRVLDAGLEEDGLLKVQRTRKLGGAAVPIITFTDKAKPYLIPRSSEDETDKIQKVKVGEEIIDEVTAIQMNGDQEAVVEYKTSLKNITPFSKLSKSSSNGTNRKAIFRLDEGGWRLP